MLDEMVLQSDPRGLSLGGGFMHPVSNGLEWTGMEEQDRAVESPP